MRLGVKVVTDSSCDLPKELAEQWDITVIPCNVHFGDEAYKDGVDLFPDEFYSRLVSSPKLPTTAQPSVNDFLQVYKALSDDGHDVVSVHLSAKFSGTLNSAHQAKALCESARADGAPNRIEIIDSRVASAPLGLLALGAARVAKGSSSCDQVLEEVEGALDRVHCYFLLDTLEYLQKGGRIGKASAFLGSLLSIKPILTIKDGEAHPAERVRTRERGLQRLVDIVGSLAPAEEICIVHSTAPEDAQTLRERLSDLMPQEKIIMSRFGPVVGTYLGPGVLGVGLVSAR